MARLAAFFTPRTSVCASIPLSSNQKNPKNPHQWQQKEIDGKLLLGREYKTVTGNEPWRAPANMKELPPAHQ